MICSFLKMRCTERCCSARLNGLLHIFTVLKSWTIRLSLILSMVPFAINLEAQPQNGTVIVVVRSDSGKPVSQVEVQVGEQYALTDDRGEAMLAAPSGTIQVNLQRYGFASKTVRAIVNAAETTRLVVELEAEAVVKETIVVTATRNDVLIEDEALRVEVLDRDEVDEKTTMTPGDIAM